MKLVKHITPGEEIPRFFGVAWLEQCLDRAVCLPLGLNLIAGFVRICYHAMRHGLRDWSQMYSWTEQSAVAYQRGLKENPQKYAAYHDGYRAGKAFGENVRRDVGTAVEDAYKRGWNDGRQHELDALQAACAAKVPA